MTVWAFVSDVHGNLRALLQAEQLARVHGADRFIALGDIIGRGDPNGCVAWVEANAVIAIVGNRDLDYVDRVTPELQQVVRGWRHEASASDFVVSHGDPKLHRPLNSAAERDGFRRVRAFLEERGARIWFFGHTHRARCWALGDDVHPLSASDIALDGSARYVVNVGTTGLPLPGRGGASFVIYDDGVGVVRFMPLDARGQPKKPML